MSSFEPSSFKQSSISAFKPYRPIPKRTPKYLLDILDEM